MQYVVLKDILITFQMTVDRKSFYLQVLSYCEYKMHPPDVILFKECFITQHIIILVPHVI